MIRAKNSLYALKIGITVAAFAGSSTMAANTPSGGDELSAGEYIARAGACMTCHREDLSGGYEVATPMGGIVATNISPSISYGIGTYSFEDFDRAMREGRTPEHYLYPAMPFAAYRGMSDADMRALYSWIMQQPPVDEPLAKHTDLPFPFNIRLAMIAWKAVALNEVDRVSAQPDPILARGAYIVDHLGHCGQCHTPRTATFGLDEDQHLAGAVIDGWWAPNITGNHIGGAGAWPIEGLVEYLKSGYSMDVAQAAGPMQKTVHHSTSHLDEADLMAIAAYLQSTPPLDAPGVQRPAFPPLGEIPEVSHGFNEIREELATALQMEGLTPVEQSFIVNCAACHGVDGEGQPEAYYPPLINNIALRREDPRNLIRVLVEGIPAGGLYRSPGMPGFGDKQSNEQIAAMANYVRARFGDNPQSAVTAEDVSLVMSGEEPPLLMKLAPVLAWIGIILGLLALGFIIWLVVRRNKSRSET